MAQLTQQQRHINNLQANQAKQHEHSVKQFSRQFGKDIMALSPKEVRRIKRKRQRQLAQQSRHKRNKTNFNFFILKDKAKS